MKKTYQFVATIILLLIGNVLLFAIPPAPGLDLVEPHRPRVPFAFSSNSMYGKRQLVSQHGVPAINLAPRGLLILANFSDTTFSPVNTQLAFDSLANGADYTYNGATGSCKAYFTAQSNGKYSPNFDVIGPITLPHTSAYYGTDTQSNNGDDRYVVDFVVDACMAADKLGVDFSQYDNDQDGNVDFVYIIYAGFGQADGGAETTIWPHNWDLISALFYKNTNQSDYYAYYDEKDSLIYKLPTIDGKTLYTYACSNELKFRTKARSGIGTICHEFSHVLGLPDYYITDSKFSNLEKYTPGAWSLMGYGNYLNNGNTPPNFSIFDKYYLGWIEPNVLNHSTTYQLPADGKTGYMIARNDVHVDLGPYRTDTVYYLENRQKEGWDEYLPGQGMLIWRVMYDEEKWYNNSPNDFKTRYRLMCAQEDAYPYTTSEERPEVPFPGTSNQTEFISFSPVNYLENIQETAEGMITFDFVTENKTPVENLDIQTNQTSQSSAWYNLLGQPINPETYKGIVIHGNKKYLLR